MRQYEEAIVSQTQHTVSNLIRQGQYDAATNLAQKAIAQDIDLVWKGSGKPL